MADALLVAWSLLKVLIGLGFVVALAYAFTRVLAQRLPSQQGPSGVRLLGYLYLGGRRGLALVKVGPRVLVLGVSDHAVHLVERISDPQEVAALEGASAPPLFAAQRLRDFQRLLWDRLRSGGGGGAGGGA